MAKRRHSFISAGFTEMGRIASKNNSALLSKKSRSIELASQGKDTDNNEEKLSPEALEEIRLRIKNQQHKREKKLIFLGLLSIIVAIGLIYGITKILNSAF